MQTARRWTAAIGLAATLGTTGCLCGAEEEHAFTVSAPDSLVVTRDGTTRRIETVVRVAENQLATSTFQLVFNTLEGTPSSEGIALSLSGHDPVTDELVTLTLALPVSLRRGDEYVVGNTFAIPPGIDLDPRLFGAYDLRQSNQAEVSFSIAKYLFPPPSFDVRFRATTSAGTVRVTTRQKGRVELTLNLSFTDATGRPATLTGRVSAVTERYTPPCTS